AVVGAGTAARAGAMVAPERPNVSLQDEDRRPARGPGPVRSSFALNRRSISFAAQGGGRRSGAGRSFHTHERGRPATSVAGIGHEAGWGGENGWAPGREAAIREGGRTGPAGRAQRLTFSSMRRMVRLEPLNMRFRDFGRQRRSIVFRRLRLISAIKGSVG